MSLNVKIELSGDDVIVTFDGMLNEESTVPDLDQDISGRLILKLEKLDMINSIGCRTWLTWIRTLKPKKGIVLERCSPVFIGQVSVLKGFAPPDSTIESFFLPYHCDACDHDANILFNVGQDTKIEIELPCPKCGDKMECDVVAQTYQRFLAGPSKNEKY